MTKPAAFTVAPPSAFDDVPKSDADRRTAVFIAHGMGQQIPYETLAQVAEGLQAANGASSTPPVARSVFADGQWLPRMELSLKGADGETVDTHVYEGYWAPLTEGRIGVKQVITFLIDAARNGIKNGESGYFTRLLFGNAEKFPIAVRTIIYLLGALFTTLALVAMNTTIVVVSTARGLLTQTPPWLSDGLFTDLTFTFNAVISVSAIFGIALIASSKLKGRGAEISTRNRISSVILVGFVITLAAIMLAGLSLPLLFYGHIRGNLPPAEPMWASVFSPASVAHFNAAFDTWGWRVAELGAAIFVIRRLYQSGRAFFRDMTGAQAPRSAIVVGIAVAITLAAAALVRALMGAVSPQQTSILSAALSWALLVAMSAFVRNALVQFVGDVAIYIAPYQLDGFYELRAKILAKVLAVAKRVYQMKGPRGKPWYDRVIIVGHSLGSVIVYDTLNQLVREEAGGDLDATVVARTPLLLTFGSPLDKTAFIFAGQAGGRGTGAAREAVAVTKQPLIADYAYRPTWINIYSRWDIISGRLNFYDPPSVEKYAKVVDNREDPEATTLLAAHTEYWQPGSLLFATLHAAV